MSPRRWVPRAALAGLVVLLVFGAARYEHTHPDWLRLVLLVAVGVAALSLLFDTAVIPEPDWEVVSAKPARPSGQDPSLNRNVHLLENHLSSRAVDPVLQRRLTGLTDARLAQVGLQRGGPGVAERLGPTLCDVIDSPARRLSRAEVEECVSRIEQIREADS